MINLLFIALTLIGLLSGVQSYTQITTATEEKGTMVEAKPAAEIAVSQTAAPAPVKPTPAPTEPVVVTAEKPEMAVAEIAIEPSIEDEGLEEDESFEEPDFSIEEVEVTSDDLE